MNKQRYAYAPDYKLISAERTTDDGISYASYGIKCVRENVLFGEDTICTIEDISSNPALVESMINLFNMCCLGTDCFPQAVLSLIS